MSGGRLFYLDTSVVLRALLEAGVSPELDAKLGSATALVTSRLALVESARALLRLGRDGRVAEAALADAEREIESLWRRCEVFELSRAVCDLAARIAPRHALRALDALHAATFVLARRRLAGLELLTADERLRAAVEGAVA
jgi:predicted nucleic acid-binding protein